MFGLSKQSSADPVGMGMGSRIVTGDAPPALLATDAAEVMEAVEAVESRDAVDPPESGDFTSWDSTKVPRERASS